VSTQAKAAPEAAPGEWAEHALAALADAGYRRGGARTAVVEALAEHDCAVTALDLDDELRRRKPAVGRASVYRALEQLEQLGLVQRIEVCRGTAGFERVDPTGHHHHHAICRDCGRMVPFEDKRLEQALEQVAGAMPGFDVAEHDVVLRGVCERCSD
jgi:Fur family transcriptional regulator, ferric uptake regulator